MLLNQLLEAQRRFQDELLRKAGVVGVAVGFRDRKGEATDELALIALVERKQAPRHLASDDLVPPDLDGARVDVVEIGRIEAQQNPRERFRPRVPAGVSVGHVQVTAGTLGALVRDNNTGERFILSNNHVLANSNDARVGDPILQPAELDGGDEPQDIVAYLERFIPLHYIGDPPPTSPPPEPQPPTPQPPAPQPPDKGDDPSQQPSGCNVLAGVAAFGNWLARLNGSEERLQVAHAQSAPPATRPSSPLVSQSSASNQVDVALARPLNPEMIDANILNIGSITGTRMPFLKMRVRKQGRTSGYTEGEVRYVNSTVEVGYNTLAGPKTARFVGQIIASGMSQGGDSGSLVVEAGANNAVGLLFAGSGVATIFTPIETVLSTLNVSLV